MGASDMFNEVRIQVEFELKSAMEEVSDLAVNESTVPRVP